MHILYNHVRVSKDNRNWKILRNKSKILYRIGKSINRMQIGKKYPTNVYYQPKRMDHIKLLNVLPVSLLSSDI